MRVPLVTVLAHSARLAVHPPAAVRVPLVTALESARLVIHPLAVVRVPLVTALAHSARFAVHPLPVRFADVRAKAEDAPGTAEMATAAIDQLLRMLPDDTDPPATLLPLKSAISDGDDPAIIAALYAVMIDQTLDFDVSDEGMLVQTVADYSKYESDPAVREKMSYIYSYGITMYQRGMIGEQPLKDLVESKIASRVGLDGAGLDQWLSVPAVV